jgi:RNA polymerase sigma factor (sigma-70 family)
MDLESAVEGLLRELAPQTLAALTRRYGHFELAEDAVQEALLAAATSWSTGSMPDNPAGWLTTVATRRLTDLLRSEQARHRRERTDAVRALPLAGTPAALGPVGEQDDSLVLLFLCCHPAVSPPAQVALTLRAVGGLTTAEIARSLLLPEATITRRITRAKQSILAAGGRFALPEPADRAARLDVVLHVIYLIFTEGHTATAGDALVRNELCAEAIRLGRLLRRLLPAEPEVGGLLAQMLLTDARRAARTGPSGQLVPLAEQDGPLGPAAIAEGIALITESLGRRRPGPYQLQAAISAVHAEAETYDDRTGRRSWPSTACSTDWPTTRGHPEPGGRPGPGRGTGRRAELVDGSWPIPVADHHRVHSVRAHLLEAAGRPGEAAEQYRAAARRTLSAPERQYLLRRAAILG